jgi:hypothetical protein
MFKTKSRVINENDPTNPEATHQLSTLEVLEKYNGKVNPRTTKDEEEKLQVGKDFKVNIHGIEGDYTKEEFKKKFNEEFAKIVQYG